MFFMRSAISSPIVIVVTCFLFVSPLMADQITISPEKPHTDNPIEISVSWTLNQDCSESISSLSKVNGNLITIDITQTNPQEICLSAEKPVIITEIFENLPTGEYRVIVNRNGESINSSLEGQTIFLVSKLGTQTISLDSGWNPIFLQVSPMDPSPDAVFEDLGEDFYCGLDF